MKLNHLKTLVASMALVCGVSLNLAAAGPLKVGDPAPKLQTGKWVQGDAVKEFQAGKAYIVEFWATWCGPCRVSIPHLNEIHNKFKDKGLIVIGQDCWENDEKLVAPFLKEMGDKMTYRVALDDKQGSEKGKMAETWMDAAGQNGIPTAFIVDTKGTIAWIGHPMTMKEDVIEQVLAGTYDLKKAAADAELEKKNEAELNKIGRDLTMAIRSKNWDEAMTKVSEVEKLLPAEQRENLDMTRFGILLGKKDYEGAYKFAQKSSDEHKDNAMLQNQMAWMIATDPSLEKRDLGVAETLATRANAASKEKEPAIMDTLARVLFMRDKKEQAIALQEKAIKLAGDGDKADLQKTLESYKKGELPKAD